MMKLLRTLTMLAAIVLSLPSLAQNYPVVNPPRFISDNHVSLHALYVSTSNQASLSGNLTVDGATTAPGQVVLIAGQSTTSQNGLYISQAGAWTRAAQLPSGFVIQANCDVLVQIELGSKVGHTFVMITGASLTVGSSALLFVDRSLSLATQTIQGTVFVSSNGNTTVASMENSPQSVGGSVGDCVTFSDITGGVADFGTNFSSTFGGCSLYELTSGHQIFDGPGAPTVNHGALAAGSFDNRGSVTGIGAGVTSITLTFKSTYTAGAPVCIAQSNAATPFAISTTAVSTTAVTFTFAALAGSTTIYYICL